MMVIMGCMLTFVGGDECENICYYAIVKCCTIY